MLPPMDRSVFGAAALVRPSHPTVVLPLSFSRFAGCGVVIVVLFLLVERRGFDFRARIPARVTGDAGRVQRRAVPVGGRIFSEIFFALPCSILKRIHACN